MTTVGAVAAWTTPVLFTVVVARVFGGAPDAPLLVLLTLLAPLVALVAPSPDAAPQRTVVTLSCLASAGLVLWANVTVIGDAANLLGSPRAYGVVAAVALAAIATFVPRGRVAAEWSTGALLVALAGVLVALVALGATARAAPWAAWREVASRPALVFGEASAWTTGGGRVARATTLLFTEAHRVTVLSAGTYRVLERDADTTALREWRLSAGDALALRPGDRLALEAGARVRFEAGKRVPGAAPSGVAWADPPERRSPQAIVRVLGLAVTLLGGAAAAVRSVRPTSAAGAVAAPALTLGFALAAACWGIYVVHGAPELSVGAAPLAPTLQAHASLMGSPWGRGFALLTVAALGALLLGTACALRDRVVESARVGNGRVLWVALVATAGVASLWAVDAWRVLLAGFGLATAAWVAPLLTGGDERSSLIGSLVGLVAFAGLAVLGWRLPPWAAPVTAYPALVAAPIAWLAGMVVRAAGPSRPEASG